MKGTFIQHKYRLTVQAMVLILAAGRAVKSIDVWDVTTGKQNETRHPKVKQLVQLDSATILDLKLDANAKTLISESSTGIGQSWALN